MFTWVLSVHTDYKIATFIYKRYIEITKNSKMKTDEAMLRVGVRVCLYLLHKLLDLPDEKKKSKPVNQPKLMCLVFLIKELNRFLNVSDAVQLVSLIERLATRDD